MSKLGDVVFCVDCDRLAEPPEGSVAAEGADAPHPPRRMAVKKDANGDRLCALCLDARRANRNAAFLRDAGRSPSSSQGHEAPVASRVLRVASAIRIPRPASGEKVSFTIPVGATSEHPPSRKPEVARTPRLRAIRASTEASNPGRKARAGTREREFAGIAAEIGLVRTRLLLAELKQKLRSSR